MLLRLVQWVENSPNVNMQLLTLSLIIVLTAFARSDSFNKVDDCGSEVGNFSTISVSDCDTETSDYCPPEKGSNATVTALFTTSEEIKDVVVLVYGIIAGVPVPFNLPNPHGCVDSGLTCPLEPNRQFNYTTTLPVLHSYPKIKVTIKWILRNENSKDIICFLVPARIV